MQLTIPPLQEKVKNPIEQLAAVITQHQATIDTLMLRTLQQQQVIEQYRVSIYNLELRCNLIIKMLEEKGFLVKDEFEKRWPIYLRNDVGIIDQSGKMAGSLKITFYGN